MMALPKRVKKSRKLLDKKRVNLKINKVKYYIKDLVLDNKKSDKELTDILNILTDCPDINKKLKELAIRPD